jgi:hypothetical protein
MSFQWIIDNAETVSIDRRQIVASTQARDGTVRAVSRGGQAWKFVVKLPDGPKWTDYRQQISITEKLDKVTTGTFKFSDTGHRWLVGYQGNSANYTGFVASATKNSPTLTLTTSPSTSSGFKFRAGDFIQLGNSGKVYTVAADVPFNSNTVTLHRPVLDATASYTLRVAENCEWTVICTQFPQWTLFARDQISWDGPFIFVENLV